MAVNAALREELASLEPTSLIELFRLDIVSDLDDVCTIYRFHAGVNSKIVPGNIIWNSEAYQAWPVAAEGFQATMNGSFPRPKFRLANVDGEVSKELLVFNAGIYRKDFIGSKLTRIRTLAKFLDATNFEGGTNPFGTPDPNVSLPDEIYYIDRKSLENRDYVEFECVASLDLQGIRIPGRTVLKNACSWIYKGSGCNYAGTDYFDENDNRVGSADNDVCGKQLSSCRKRFGKNEQLPFGGFPGAGPYPT